MEFDNAILQVSERIKRPLEFIPQNIKQNCEEIRIRSGLPVCLTVNKKVMFVCQDSIVTKKLPKNCLIATVKDITQTLSLLCNNSIYMHEEEIKQGYVSLQNGNRAGVCGHFNAEGMLVSVGSINIRIARQVFGCAYNLLPYAKEGLLIAGPPGCGKTTILRDLIRLLSNGEKDDYFRVTVVDSRNELSGGGVLDVGVNTDVIYTSDKAKGTQIALRTMFPDFIAFDEIGTNAEYQSVCDCLNAGTTVLTTAHCQKKEDLLRREVTKKIIKSGAIKNFVLLSNNLEKPPQFFEVKELLRCVLD